MGLQQQLRDFYLLDKRLRGMRSRLDAAQRRERAVQGRLDQYKQQHDELISQQKQLQAHVANLEGQADDIDEKIKKLRDQMNTVTTNKEYSAILVEVNTLKVEKGKIEEQALEHMTQLEAMAEQIQAAEAKVSDQQTLVAAAEKEVAEAREEVGEQVDTLQAERDEAAKGLPAETLAQFDRMAEAYEGEAMAEIIEIDRRRLEYQCGGCHMGVPRQNVNALLTGSDRMILCPSCGRILYVEEELKTSLAPK